ncbi:hypothetical protein SDJN03_19769, partial [Cucurbita argyrosperma subsp. sororia]
MEKVSESAIEDQLLKKCDTTPSDTILPEIPQAEASGASGVAPSSYESRGTTGFAARLASSDSTTQISWPFSSDSCSNGRSRSLPLLSFSYSI